MTSEMDNHDDIDDTLSIIKANLNSQEDDVISEASNKFKLLLQEHNECIPSKVFKWAKNNDNVTIRALLSEKLQEQITKITKNNPSELITFIPVNGTDVDREYVINLLMEAVDSLSEEIIKHLLCGSVIPELFNADHQNKEAHDVLIDFAFELIEKLPITKLNAEEVKLFTLQVIEKYIKVLEKWREVNFSRWHELWMFLVRFSAKHLHTAMDLANKLLRVVEFAFRNPSYEQRLKGYECWKELIDNASLDMKHMCSSKQIRLLMTPLRAKFSKMEVVICKRFEVFLYLLEKLQTDSVLCLNEFLEFCFGVSNTNSSSKNGQGKLVPNLWLRSIQVFLAILGDQTHIAAELKRKLFERAIINESNLDRFHQVVVCSVIESSTILKIISVNISEKINILKCLWKALFETLTKSSKEVQEKCFRTIFNSLNTLFTDFNEDITYSSLLCAFSQLLDMGIDYSIYSDSFKLLIESSVKFLVEQVVSEELYNQFEESFLKLRKEKHTFELLTEQLKKLDPTKNEVIIHHFWKNLGLGILKDDDQSQSIIPILLWPVLHLNKCANIFDSVRLQWVEIFSETAVSNKKVIINEINKTFKSNPLLSSNISTVISSLGEDDINLEEDIVESLLKLMASIMSLPLLSQETAEKLFPLILKCTRMVIANKNIDLESVDYICQCLQKIPVNQKNSTSLETIESLVKKVVPLADTNVSNKLKILMTLFTGTKVQKKASKIAGLLSPEVNTTPSSIVKRSIRMTQMVFDKDGSTPNKEKVDALQLFGKDVETLTPFKVKGSTLQSTPSPSTSSRSKRIINSVKKSHLPGPPIIDDQSCEFVVIDTEVKFQKDLLTDHQKETLRKRREDIPALYQDLSQSQTQSSLSTDTQSNIISTVRDKNENEEKVAKSIEEECPFLMASQKIKISVEEKPTSRIIEELKKLEENDSNTDSNDESESKKRKFLQKKRELMRIQMDIVGGNSFIQNLPSKRPRKMTPKITPKKANVTTEDDQTPAEKLEIQPVVVIENIPSISSLSNILPDESSSEKTPNRRKNKLMKPIKNFGSPSSEKKTNKTPVSKKKEKEIKVPKASKKTKTPSKTKVSEAPDSEILFESEIIEDKTEKIEHMKGTPKKNIRKSSGDRGNEINKLKKEADQVVKNDVILFESRIIEDKTEENEQMKGTPRKNSRKSSGDRGNEVNKIKKDGDQVVKNEVTKPKKSPKEFMKKSKEKVRTIQSQLKLANISNLDVSSEKSKPKNAKLIFIRELTNLKNPQDTKVSPAGLKRNSDNKSKNIAYTIETPATSVNISSLVNIDDMQPPCSESSNTDNYIQIEKVIPRKRRKRTSSVSVNNLTMETPESDEKSYKVPKLQQSTDEDYVEDIKQSIDKEKVCEIRQSSDEAKDTDVVEGVEPIIEKMERKRKPLRETIEENYPSSESSLFSPESPSRSTRSRTNSPMTNTTGSPKRQISPRGVRTLFKDSEDIIESSQGSFTENSSISIGNLSRSKIKQSPKLQNVLVKSEEIEKVAPSPDMNTATDVSPQVCNIEDVHNIKNEIPISQATTLTCESNYEAQPPVVQVETQEKHELSDSEKLLSMADTVSIESPIKGDNIQKEDDQEIPVMNIGCEKNDEQIVEKTDSINEDISKDNSPVSSNMAQIETFGTPQKRSDNLPGSPVSQATPTFKKELLDNTSDISPIGSQSTDSDDQMAKDILEALDAAIGEKNTSKEAEEVASISKSSEDNKLTSIVLSSNERSNKLLNMVNVVSPVSSQKKGCKRKLASPGLRKTRYEKLFSFYRNQDNGSTANKEDGPLACAENAEDILTFSRDVPSPLAVPSSSILKRKLTDTDDSYSPCPKRKRVNFSYPCITSTKLFIRHKDELNSHYKPTFATNLFEDDAQQGESEEEDPFADPESYGQVGSEESMDITNSLSLYSNKPIDEQLVDCDDNLDCLWKRLSTPMGCDKLKEILKSKNIETVGHLASLNEIEINRLPFKDPKVKTVRKALFHYLYRMSNVSKTKEQDSNAANSPTSSEEQKDEKIDVENNDTAQTVEMETNTEIIEDDNITPLENLNDEFRMVVTKMKEKGSSLEEFGEIFIDLVDESDVINLLESVYNTNFRRFFGKPHWRYLVETIVKTGGTSELFDIISDLAENNKVFADQLEHIVQVRIDQDPLKNILRKKTLVQVSTALQDCIEEGEFPRENVLQTCLMPLIKSPSDIRNYFNSLTIVQIHDLFIERVQPSDLTCFLDQIKDHYGNYTIAQCANKQDVLKICSKEDLATTLIAKENEVGAVKHLISHIDDERKLLELYNYIGNLLPFKSRIDSHIDLLRSIPFDKNQDE